MMAGHLPSTWSVVPLSHIVDINPRGAPQGLTDESLVSFIPMAAVEEQTGRADVSATRLWGAVRKGYTTMQDEDIIFAKITPCMENGKVALVNGLMNRYGAGSTEFTVLRASDAVCARYLLHYLLQQKIRNLARAVMRGAAGQLRVPTSFFAGLQIPLPPIDEQRRIVTALEEHLSDLDAAVTTLERTRQHLSVFVASVLQAAANTTLIDGDSVASSVDRVEWRPFREVIESIDQGWSPKCLPEPPIDDDHWGVIKTTAIQPTHFNSRESKALPPTLQPRRHLEIQVGDLLVTRKGPRSRAGVAAAVRTTRQKLMVCDTVYRIRLKEHLARPHFIAIAMSAPRVAMVIDAAKAGISESGVSLTHDRLGAVNVPLPTLQNQQRIEDEVDRRLASVDHIAADIDVQLARAVQLRQSILKRAFEGKLVLQDSNDEPASVPFTRVDIEHGESLARTARSRRSRVPSH